MIFYSGILKSPSQGTSTSYPIFLEMSIVFKKLFHVLLERVSGIEPPSEHWQCPIITIIRHPLMSVPRVRIELTTSSFSEKRSTTELPRLVCVDAPGLEPGTFWM